MISEAVLKVLEKEQLVVRGLPWQEADEMKIGRNTLTARCLCVAHNSALSDLDSAAAQFFSAIEKADHGRQGPGSRVLISGHDIERWMLKTLLAMAHSRNLSRQKVRLRPTFHVKLNATDLLTSPLAWPPGSGLYFTQGTGDRMERDDTFGLAPLVKPNTEEIVGMLATIQGLECTLLAVSPDATWKGVHRPSGIRFKFPTHSNVVEFSWEDSKAHSELLFTYQGTIAQRIASGLPRPESMFGTRRP